MFNEVVFQESAKKILDEFVKRLASLGGDFGVELPKGAGANVDALAKELFSSHGLGALARVAKMHFRTALRAQGLPEPPKVEWRGSGVSKKK